MELIDGLTLKQYMQKKNGSLHWRESLYFTTQIVRALGHAHSRGIIHRDIKPQNIMVLRDGSVRVADFGIACLENSAQTLTQEAFGSVHYISPEQAKGDRIDARSDIYSAGVVLYEMLTGRLPFEGDSAVSVALQHLSSIPLAPREINKGIPEQLELICMKAMASNLERRYYSADAMIADLEAFRKNPEVDLDFELEDLRPSEVDEPTRPIRTAAVHAAAQSHRSSAPSRERRRDYDDYDDDDRRRDGGVAVRTALWVGAGLLAAVLVFFLFRSIFASFGQQAAPEQYVVPSVIGMTVEEAMQMDSVKDIFTLEKQTEIFNDEYAIGEIVRQDPEAGVHRKGDNTRIKVWISAGEEIGKMPDVSGMTAAQAKKAMQNLSTKYQLILDDSEELQKFSDEVEKGVIISTYPAAGDPLKKGDTIQLIVSKGKELKEIKVINFVGSNIESARNNLETMGLICKDTDIEVVPSEENFGVIIWQSLESGTIAYEGDTIKFRVSSGSSGSQPSYGSGEILQTYLLPQDGRKEVHVQIKVSQEDRYQFDEIVPCDKEKIVVTLRGSGEEEIKVYFDGELELSHLVQISE